MPTCPRKIYIYKLSDPFTGKVRYIGKTVQNLNNRLSSHISVAKYSRKKAHCQCWIKSLINKNALPTISLIEETFDIYREVFWIKFYKDAGEDLTNFSNGGELGQLNKRWKLSKETKERQKGKGNKQLYIWDIQGNLLSIYPSLLKASEYIKTNSSSIIRCIKKNISFKNQYIFSYSNIFPTVRVNVHINRRILFKKNNIEIIFRSVKEATNYLSLSYAVICTYCKGRVNSKGELYHGKNFTLNYL